MANPGGGVVVGLVGAGIGTSLTPPLHEREADELGIRYLYQLIDIDRLGLTAQDVGGLVDQARQLGFVGLNITYPCKQAVVGHLDELSAEAALLGSVNTVVFSDGRAIGHNTDAPGFAEGFRRGLPGVPKRTVVLMGAGGAGAAVAHAMLELGAVRLIVVDVEPARAERLVSALHQGGVATAGEPGGDRPTVVAAAARSLPTWLAEADGLINATPVGMVGHPGVPVPVDLLRPQLWVADIIYRPLRTALLRHAEQLGCRTLNGGGMVVFQAVESFRMFTGVQPDADRMLRHFTDLTGEAYRDPASHRDLVEIADETGR